MNKKNKLENSELAKLSNHIGYEFGMLEKTIYPFEPINPVINNCRIESFAIHTRCLLYFFLNSKKNQNDDLLAIDFFTNPLNWIEYISERKKDPKIKKIKARASKEVAHLTTSRYWEPVIEKKWKFEEVYLIIYEMMEKFIETADKNKLGEYLKDTFNKAIKLSKEELK